MHTSVVFRIVLLIIIFFFCTTSSIQIGKIQYTMLSTNNTNVSTHISASSSDCLCRALMNSSVVVAMNYFANNYTCELFSSYGPWYEVRVNSISTLFLIKPLPIRSHAANLTWLLDAIGNAAENYTSVTISMPRNLYIDDHNRLVTNEFYGRLIQMDRPNLSIINQITLNTTFAGALSYNDGLYYIGAGGAYKPVSEDALFVYNSSTMDLVTKITGDVSYFGPIRQCCFARNNTLMIVLSQVSFSFSFILLYQINSPNNYTLINKTIQTPNFGAYNIFKVNDTFFYFVLYTNILHLPVYTLTSSLDGEDWTIGTFITQGPQPYLVSSIAVDTCGRVWAADQYSCIYIYDASTGALLGMFNKIPSPYFLLLLDNYELFVTSATNRTYRLAPNIDGSC